MYAPSGTQLVNMNQASAASASQGVGASGYAGMIGAIAGAVSSVAVSIYAGKISSINYDMQKSAAEFNAWLSESRRQQMLEQGRDTVKRVTMQAGKLKASQRVRMAANGMDLNYGSNAEIEATTEFMKDVDMDTAMMNAIYNSMGESTRTTNFLLEANTAGTSASSAKSQANTLAATSLLSSATAIADRWYVLSKGA